MSGQITPDVVLLVQGILTAGLATLPGHLAAPVVGEVPNPRPERFVVVSMAGGPGRTAANPVVDRAAVTVEAWADHREWANDLATDARAVLLDSVGSFVDGVQMYRVEDSGTPVPLPDPLDSGQHRVTFTVVATVRMRRRTA